MNRPRLVVAGTHSGAGKTTLTQGLILALVARKLTVQPYKCGPDYIDPGYHTVLSGRISRNLDTMLIPANRVLELFDVNARDADVSIIEGVMGLFDGAGATDERGSTSHIAKIVRAPVVLVMDARAMARSAGAVAHGYAKFERNIDVGGFILNNVGSERHYRMAKEAIEWRTGLPVFGYLPRRDDLRIPERHLGLVPAWESEPQQCWRDRLLSLIDEYIDVDGLLRLARSAPPLPVYSPVIYGKGKTEQHVRIGYALDDAFHFYYQDNLDMLGHIGAEMVPFSPMQDEMLPDGLDGLYFGGGYPELFAEELENNEGMKAHVRRVSAAGMPILAECGGLMYIVRYLRPLDGRDYEMVGLFPGRMKMRPKLKMLGYYTGELQCSCPLGRTGKHLLGHVYHWSELEEEPSDELCRAFVLRKPGRDDQYDGFIRHNTVASYLHLHFAGELSYARNFVRSCRAYANRRGSPQGWHE